MPSRRQEKVARSIKEVVSDAIINHLSDPRIECFVSVTRVDMSPDLRNADIYLSVFGKDEASQNKTFEAICHARSRLQSIVAKKIHSRFCPSLRILKDEKSKKTLDIINLINETTKEIEEKEEIEEIEQ